MDSLEQRYIRAKRALFDKAYSARLNDRQREAVFTAKGPLLVLAGAGSGKTTVLVNRIEYLIKFGNAYYSENIHEGLTEGEVIALEGASALPEEEIEEILPEFIEDPCPPWCVLAITFTNKAASEIKERLSRVFDGESAAEEIWAGTFHSVCVRILRRYGDRIGYRSGFSIYDTDDKKRLISACMKELNIDEKLLSSKAVAAAISREKDNLRSPDEFQETRDPRSRDIGRIFALYQKKLLEYNALDFDDIIMQAVRLLEQDREALAYYSGKFRYVLVDEYQDTNYAQFYLTSLLSQAHRNIMVVGDDDQSIYKFRGATIENILNFDKTYPDAKVIKLEQNYRSTETILDAANAIISHNENRHEKKLWSIKGRGDRIQLYEAPDQNAEAKYIISKINEAVVKEGRRYSDFAVLYRLNELARTIESAFAKSGVPYRVFGTQRFYDKKEIRDIAAYLAVISSSPDDIKLKRIINEPKRKIGASTVDAVERIAAETGVSMMQVIERAGEYPEISKSAERLSEFVSLITSLRMDAEKMKPSELIRAVYERSGYEAMLKSEGFEGEGRIASVGEFVSAAADYERRCEEGGETASLTGFLEEIALVSDVDKYDENADAVVLMTVHSAKGLEFPVVFLAGMEDGIFPSMQNLYENEEMSEERRLAYVAVTRAKEKIYITHSRERMMYGRTGYNQLSVFVREELPEELIRREKPRTVPPRAPLGYSPSRSAHPQMLNGELTRRADTSAFAAKERRSAASFGIEKLPAGTRVLHSVFGEGEIVSAKDMGGDVLYEVRFGDATKKLMASYAKLKKL